MRVRISYGMELEDVPERMRQLVQESLQQLAVARKLLERVLEDLKESEENSSAILESIDKARKKLSDTDLSIGDVQVIVKALDDYYKGEQNVPDRRPTMDPSGDTTTQTEGSGEG